jgi:hypothetical protein
VRKRVYFAVALPSAPMRPKSLRSCRAGLRVPYDTDHKALRRDSHRLQPLKRPTDHQRLRLEFSFVVKGLQLAVGSTSLSRSSPWRRSSLSLTALYEAYPRPARTEQATLLTLAVMGNLRARTSVGKVNDQAEAHHVLDHACL